MRVLITGTSSGIGKAIAEKFLKEGFDVTGFDRKEASIRQESYTHFCLDIRARAVSYTHLTLPTILRV